MPTFLDKNNLLRLSDGSWNTSDPVTINVGSAAVPVSKMLPVGDKLWCSCHNTVKIFDTVTLQFQVSKTRTRTHKLFPHTKLLL